MLAFSFCEMNSSGGQACRLRDFDNFEMLYTTRKNKRLYILKTKNKKLNLSQPMRWDAKDWAWLDEVAKTLGISRSEFFRNAALEAAKATTSSQPPYFVGCQSGTRQNTRTNLLEQKSPSGEVCSTGAEGVALAKGATTKAPISQDPEGLGSSGLSEE